MAFFKEDSLTEQAKAAGESLIRIIHPSDFTASSRAAFAHALKIALQSKAELELVHVQEHQLGSEKDVHWTDFPGVRAMLASWQILPADARHEDVAGLGLRVKKVLNAEADPLEAMVAYCEAHPPDLLVLATHQRHGLSRWLHRAVAEPLARRSRAMTLFVPESARGFISPDSGAVTLRRILIPVDHAPGAQAALEEAYALTAGFDRHGVVFKLLHVGTDQGMPAVSLPQRAGWRWEQRLVPGEPVASILKEAADWSPDLVVMATQGHTDFLDALRGSTSERVLRGVHCPVLAVPAKPADAAERH
jgi:nucleotide-binding universal stress UspA family protein